MPDHDDPDYQRVAAACARLGPDWRPVRQHTGEVAGLNGYVRLYMNGRGWRARFDNGALGAEATGAIPADAVRKCVDAAHAAIARAQGALRALTWEAPTPFTNTERYRK